MPKIQIDVNVADDVDIDVANDSRPVLLMQDQGSSHPISSLRRPQIL